MCTDIGGRWGTGSMNRVLGAKTSNQLLPFSDVSFSNSKTDHKEGEKEILEEPPSATKSQEEEEEGRREISGNPKRGRRRTKKFLPSVSHRFSTNPPTYCFKIFFPLLYDRTQF
ncbi:hypothetical protein NE237_007630 [Protea cynaroides]|uniref:Uncharacterized protein n=1 Tax=Protea cynaroides TaxID=273540 RepID=A0A9Q0KPT0_9MAGN|nr:hypothetical protein NE237_007630 [Protea cynaroides]